LIKLIVGKRIIVESCGICAHGRTLATLNILDDGKRKNINVSMVYKGHAWVMRRFYKELPNKRKHELNRAENWAKQNNIGLWGQGERPIPP